MNHSKAIGDGELPESSQKNLGTQAYSAQPNHKSNYQKALITPLGVSHYTFCRQGLM